MPPRNPPSPLELEARRSALYLVDLIQTATAHYPRLVIAINEAARAFIAEDQRRSLKQRIAELDANQLAELDGLLAQMERGRSDEPSETEPSGDDVA